MNSPRPTRGDFGGWRYEHRTAVLALYDEGGRWIYEVDLERCQTSAAMLDWIMQVADKSWATDAILAGLVRALDFYLYPQETLCSFETESGPIDVRAILGRTAQR